MTTPHDSMGVTPLVDWLTWTVPFSDEKLKGLPYHEAFTPDGELAAGVIKPYDNALRAGCATVYWSSAHPEWKLCYVMTGSDLNHFRQIGGRQRALVREITRLGGKITRLDMAFDMVGDDFAGDVMDLVLAFNQGWMKTGAKKMTHILEESAEGTRKGCTVYIGSRQSNRMLRVYDKGAQLETEFAYVRAELECKGDYARKCANALALFGMETVQAEIAGFVESGIPWLDNALETTEHIDPVVVGKKQTDFDAWVMRVALPNVIKAIRMGNSTLIDVLKIEIDRLDFPD
jgi:hypothetical protein